MSYLYVTDGLLPPNLETGGLTCEPGELHCQDGVIVYCGSSQGAPRPPAGAEHLPAHGGVVLPGFVNTHTHAAMTLFRGLADDLELHTWLNQHIFPLESKLTQDAVYWGSLLACLEMIKSGITCFGDMYYMPHCTARAVRRAGLRAALGETLLDFMVTGEKPQAAAMERVREFAAGYAASPDIKPVLNLHAVYTCSPALLTLARQTAEDLNLNLHMHLCETKQEISECLASYGRKPIDHLDSLGLLTSRLWVAHGVWITPEEAGLLAEREVKVAHCPNSNMKLASGRADIPVLQAAGVKVGLGTDGCASNNRLDMFREMDMCAKLHKLGAMDPTAMPASLVLRMATSLGAEVLGWPALGRLQAGWAADFIVIDTAQPHLTPMTSPISHLVYACQGGDVLHTVCQGRTLMRNKQIPHLDEREIIVQANQHLARILGS